MPQIQQIRPSNDWIGPLLGGFSDQIEKEKQEKLAIAKKLIESGQYSPQNGGANPGFGSRVMQGLTGPQLGGSNLNLGGQNFQYQSPDIQAQNMQKQIETYRNAGLIAPQSGTPQLGSSAGSYPFYMDTSIKDGKLSSDMKSMDPIKQIEMQKNQLEIDKLKREEQEQKQENELYAKSPEDIKEFVKKNDPALARVGDKIISGQISLKDISTRNPAYKKKVTDYIASQGINEQELAARNKVRMDYSVGGSIGKQITSAGTIVQHMRELSDTIKDLHNSGVPIWNRAMQGLGRTFGHGSAALAKYDAIKNTLSGEYDKYLRAGGSSEAGIDRIVQTMDESGSPEAQKETLKEGANLMAGRLGQYVDGWTNAFNRPGDPDIPKYLLSDRTKESLNGMGMGDVIQKVQGTSENVEKPSKQNNDPLGIR